MHVSPFGMGFPKIINIQSENSNLLDCFLEEETSFSDEGDDSKMGKTNYTLWLLTPKRHSGLSLLSPYIKGCDFRLCRQ